MLQRKVLQSQIHWNQSPNWCWVQVVSQVPVLRQECEVYAGGMLPQCLAAWKKMCNLQRRRRSSKIQGFTGWLVTGWISKGASSTHLLAQLVRVKSSQGGVTGKGDMLVGIWKKKRSESGDACVCLSKMIKMWLVFSGMSPVFYTIFVRWMVRKQVSKHRIT